MGTLPTATPRPCPCHSEHHSTARHVRLVHIWYSATYGQTGQPANRPTGQHGRAWPLLTAGENHRPYPEGPYGHRARPRQASAKPALSQRQPAPRPALGMRLAPKCAHGATNGNRPLPRDLGPSKRMARAVDESGHRRADHGPIPCASQSRRTRD